MYLLKGRYTAVILFCVLIPKNRARRQTEFIDRASDNFSVQRTKVVGLMVEKADFRVTDQLERSAEKTLTSLSKVL